MDLQETIKTFIMNYGMISVFVLVLLEYASVPLPSEIVLPFIGIIGAMHGISFFEILFVSLIAGLVGSIITYIIGYIFGMKVLNWVGNKIPRTRKAIEAGYKWIEKYDKGATFVSRLVPVARTFISIIAGVVKMKPVPFILFSTVGIVLWNSLLIGLGFILGNNTALIDTILHQYSLAVGGIAIVVIVFIVYRNRKKLIELFR
ncbi:DedA family protein [uncultured Clostridium sp.]|uniref:DedA family protein n=1 Tax=uncultured Clostridium sp. TaxID=59620 RepID=UPI0026310659|nr:DedA family protein [uncultured Clostridium sp.]